MNKIVCPYCLIKFKRNEVAFRCRNSRCKKVLDKELSKHWPGSEMVTGNYIAPNHSFFYRLFNRAPNSALCPVCKEKSYTYICPKCHNPIEREMVKKKGYIISIIGAKGSGKTVYITTLINEMISKLPKLGIGVREVNITENNHSRYYDDFYPKLYHDKELPQPTDPTDPRNRIPLIYRLINIKKNIYLVFYDTAGENFNQPNTISENVEYLKDSDATIYLLDTFEIPFVHERLQIRERIILRYDSLFDTIFYYFNECDPATKQAHFKKPTALVFSKIDSILQNNKLFQDAALAGMSVNNNSNYLDGSPIMLSDFDSINISFKGALEIWDEKNFLDKTDTYKNPHFFGISALGEQPVNGKIGTIKPYRVLDPLVWILHELGISLPIMK